MMMNQVYEIIQFNFDVNFVNGFDLWRIDRIFASKVKTEFVYKTNSKLEIRALAA